MRMSYTCWPKCFLSRSFSYALDGGIGLHVTKLAYLPHMLEGKTVGLTNIWALAYECVFSLRPIFWPALHDFLFFLITIWTTTKVMFCETIEPYLRVDREE